MTDVDYITCRFGPLLAKYLAISAMLRERDQQKPPKAYAAAFF